MYKFCFFAALFSFLTLNGCDRYTFSINDRLVHEPPKLFSDFDLNDKALLTCVRQTIADKEVRAADQLTSIICSHAGITNLKGIELFSKLATIDLSDNQLTEIKPLLFLPHLVRVDLRGNDKLDCKDAANLAQQIEGNLFLPEHCKK